MSNSEASDAHSSVSSGRTFSLTSLTLSSNCSSRSSSGSGCVAAKRQRGAGLGADELLVDLGRDGARADGVAVVVGGEAGLRLAVERAGDVDRDRVALLRGALDDLERAVEVAHAVDLGVERVLVDAGALERDAQPAVAGHLDRRAHLDDGVERDVARLLPAGDVDLRRGDHVDVVLDDRGRVVLGQRVVQRLLATGQRAEAGFEHLAGRLARAEAGEPHLAGDLLEGGVDRRLELTGVDLDGQLDLVALEGFDGALHAEGECTGGGATARHALRSAGRLPCTRSRGVAQW